MPHVRNLLAGAHPRSNEVREGMIAIAWDMLYKNLKQRSNAAEVPQALKKLNPAMSELIRAQILPL